MNKSMGIAIRIAGDLLILSSIFFLIALAFIQGVQSDWPRALRPVGDLFARGQEAFGPVWWAMTLAIGVMGGWIVRVYGVKVQRKAMRDWPQGGRV
jgi:hypothetical protein